MRKRGERLPAGLVRQTRPTAGELVISDRWDAHRIRLVLMATVVDTKHQFLLPVLDHVRLGKLRGDAFVLYGIEEVVNRKIVDNYPQAWWIRIAAPVPRPVTGFDERDDDLDS